MARKFNIKRHMQLLEHEAEQKERAKAQAEELAFRDDPEVCARPHAARYQAVHGSIYWLG